MSATNNALTELLKKKPILKAISDGLGIFWPNIYPIQFTPYI